MAATITGASTERFCGARNRKGQPCRRRPMRNGRCHLHGGKSPGPPKGNRNALKHGYYTREAIAERKARRQMLRAAGTVRR
jgi:uncharacterized protein YjcR